MKVYSPIFRTPPESERLTMWVQYGMWNSVVNRVVFLFRDPLGDCIIVCWFDSVFVTLRTRRKSTSVSSVRVLIHDLYFFPLGVPSLYFFTLSTFLVTTKFRRSSRGLWPRVLKFCTFCFMSTSIKIDSHLFLKKLFCVYTVGIGFLIMEVDKN